MNISTAIKSRTSDNPYITRESWRAECFDIKIYPSNTPDCCVICSTASRSPQARWNPDKDDLIAEDWVVTD